MNHAEFMKMALDLAARGFPAVAPNPMVGCVIVSAGKVVAEGFHEIFGGPHAEVNAINALPPEIDPSSCTIYVTLEPCSHHGKTPPCADLVIAKGFRQVVCAVTDPNPLVSGTGLQKMQDAGIEIIYGVLENEARELNRRFFTFWECRRPYILLKWAQTADGFISRLPVPANRSENVITRPEAQAFAHRLRAESMAIMVGKKTVESDNPLLTTRLVKGANPLRVIVDRNLTLSRDLNVFNADSNTIIFNSQRDQDEGHLRFLKVNFEQDLLQQVCDRLYGFGVQSLLVEGGAKLVNGFVLADLWDEALVFENPELRFGEGVRAPELALKNTFELVGEDKLYRQRRNDTITTGKALEI